jgi:hypothetical protein
MKKLLWLDDYRDPKDTETDWMLFSCLGRDVEIHWVKNYEEFVNYIEQNGLPDGINFDHDLEDSHYTPEKYWDNYEESKKFQEDQKHEKTGYHCAKWLIDYCIDNKKELPTWSSHSANPVGRDNINNILFNFKYKR